MSSRHACRSRVKLAEEERNTTALVVSLRRLLLKREWLVSIKVSPYYYFDKFLSGIGAAMMREASYTSLKLGLYEPFKGLTGAD